MASQGSDKEAQDRGGETGGGHSSTAKRAVVAAAATGATAYAVRRLSSRREDGDSLTETLSAKVTDAKKAAGNLKPNRSKDSLSEIAGSAWEAASEHLAPVIHNAAAAAGKAVAERAPEAVRKEVLPHFIEGLQKAS
jgi:hypothetical protein